MQSLKTLFQFHLVLIALFITILSFSVGCTSKVKRVEFPPGASASDEIAKLDSDIQQAELAQVDVTAPNFFSRAKQLLSIARKQEMEQKSSEDILKIVGEARGHLNYAIVSQQEYRGELMDILEAREMALKAGALENTPSEFQRIDWDFKKATEDYRPNKEYISYSARQSLRNRYLDLQGKALTANRNIERTLAVEELNFDPEQAEVQRDGEKILIRLKSAQFAPGDAKISDSAIPTLDKVKEILEALDQEQVKVEGFTDSTGSPIVNQQISEDRAEAVANYLLNSEGVTEGQIEYQGLGSAKPLKSNLTKEGRAMNRRVDIIITPTKVE